MTATAQPSIGTGRLPASKRTFGVGGGNQPPAVSPAAAAVPAASHLILTPENVTDQQLYSTTWAGRKTGNLFKVVEVLVQGGERIVRYTSPANQRHENEISKFLRLLQPAHNDQMWKCLEESAMAVAESLSATTPTDVGFFAEPDDRFTMDTLVLYPQTIKAVKIGVNVIKRYDELEEHWSLSKIKGNARQCAMNFYGLPGTGKTQMAKALAAALGKKLFQVDYASVISKYLGDTAKHIREFFKVATENDAILLLDEADSIVSRRINMASGEDGATSINQNRNTLMQELDKFKGIVIFSTNFFGNYDPALLRRIAQHVEFPLPNVEMLARLYKLHMPNMEHIQLTDEDIEAIANASHGFAGGDVMNAITQAMIAASLPDESEEWILSRQIVEEEVARIINYKRAHANAAS